MDRWSEATWDPATSNGGEFVDCGPKGLLHTTEGASYAGARSVYAAEGYWPHLTLTYEAGAFKAYQHLVPDVAAKALEHKGNQPQTNRCRVTQIEIVGSAVRDYAHQHRLLYVEDFPVEYLAGIARCMRYVERVTGVPPVVAAPFGLPGTVKRLTWPQWQKATGWLGHCHCPGQSHTDPGNLAVATLLPPAPPSPQPGTEDHMPRHIRDPKVAVGPDGRTPHWAVDRDGNIYCWDRARQLKSLGQIDPHHVPIEDAELHPSGDGLILYGNDGHFEPGTGTWALSTYTILVGT